MQLASKLAAASAVAVAATVVAAMPALADGPDSAAAPKLVRTTLADHGWTTQVENLELGGGGAVDDRRRPPPERRRLAGDRAGQPRGRVEGRQALPLQQRLRLMAGSRASRTSGTRAKVTATPQARLAPALNQSVLSTDEADPAPRRLAGHLVCEPIYQALDATTGSQGRPGTPQRTAPSGGSPSDVLASDGSVVIAKQTTRTMDEFLAAFDENAKYADLRLDPRGGGLQVSLGQAGATPAPATTPAGRRGHLRYEGGLDDLRFAEGIGSVSPRWTARRTRGPTTARRSRPSSSPTGPRSTATGTRSPRSRTPPTRTSPDPSSSRPPERTARRQASTSAT